MGHYPVGACRPSIVRGFSYQCKHPFHNLVAAGFLVIKDFASPEDVAALKARAEELLESFDPAAVPSIFSTRNQARQQAWLLERLA